MKIIIILCNSVGVYVFAMGNSCRKKQKPSNVVIGGLNNSSNNSSGRIASAEPSEDFIKGYLEGFEASKSSDDSNKQYIISNNGDWSVSTSNAKESGSESDSESDNDIEETQIMQNIEADVMAAEPPEKISISIFNEFMRPDIFQNFPELKIEQSTPLESGSVLDSERSMDIIQRNVKLFYEPAGSDCSKEIAMLEGLDCVVISLLDNFRPPRIIFRYEGSANLVSFSYLNRNRNRNTIASEVVAVAVD